MSPFGRFWVLVLGLSLPLWAQQQSAPAPVAGNPPVSAPTESADRQIRLDMVVTDKGGNPVPGLGEGDFTVLDNKQPQKILSFQGLQEDTPGAQSATQLILVIDEVNAGFQAISYEQQDLDKFFKQNGGRLALPTSMMMFTDSGTQIQNAPTRKGTALSTQLDQMEHSLRIINRAQGFYGAADRLQLSVDALGQMIAHESQVPGRKLVIWIGPGWPILSGPMIQLTNRQQQGIFNSVASMTNALRQAHIILYNAMPLGVGEGLNRLLYYEAFLNPVTKVGQVQPGNLAVQVLATQSGGRVLNGTSDLAAQVTNCIADAKAFYSLSFDSQPADKKNDYHRIEDIVDKPGVKVRTRMGYYAQP